MTFSNDQLIKELQRRFQHAVSRLSTQNEIDFETMLRIWDYVDFVEKSPLLREHVETNWIGWNERKGLIEASRKKGLLGWLRFRLALSSQSDFYFSLPYRRLLFVYHSINYLKGETPPDNFVWPKGMKRAVHD